VLGGACQGTATPSAPPGQPTGAPSPAGPVAPATPRSWSVYHSQVKAFSLQLPSDWTVEPGIPSEDILLQVNGGPDGRLLLLEDFPEAPESFPSYARRYFEAVLANDPDAIDFVRFEGGRAAHASVRLGSSITVYYLFAPDRGSAKVLSFAWDSPAVNPTWEMVAQRFNPYSPELIVPFGTPAPGG
jgi:hypothetical protein